jgi:ferric-chelate reductase
VSVYKWAMAGTIWKQFGVPYIAWGVAALAWFNLLWLCSLSVVRERAHNLFKSMHMLSAVFILVCVRLSASFRSSPPS